jgi:hypothetical protein
MTQLINNTEHGPDSYKKKMVIVDNDKLQINHREQDGGVKYHREFFAERLETGGFQLFCKNVCSRQESGIYISAEEAVFLIDFLKGEL